jgi:RNA polymerase sigma-70 factor (sigma-E family)
METQNEPVDPDPETGSKGRLADLYARHVPQTIGLAYLLTGDRGEAEDLVDEAFVRVVERFHHLRVPDAFDAYLRRTVVNLHTSRLRRRRVERAYLEREGSRPTLTTAVPDIGQRDELWRSLLRLPPRQRAAIVLRYYQDLSEHDTAEVLRCSTAAVKSLTARALETLRVEIRGDQR